MKTILFLIIFILTCGFDLSAQFEKLDTLSVKISGENIRPFVDSLKQQILSDTIKFDRQDLIHINGHTENNNPYSMLIFVNIKYSYRMDIIESKLVKEFVNKILVSENIESINYINEKNIQSISSGFFTKGGWVLITLKPQVKVNFNVGGLKYLKGRKSKGGNNFRQQKEGEIMIRA